MALVNMPQPWAYTSHFFCHVLNLFSKISEARQSTIQRCTSTRGVLLVACYLMTEKPQDSVQENLYKRLQMISHMLTD